MTGGPARRWRWFVAAVAACVAAASAPAAAQPLAVPFLPQSEDLCGGAAAAMVMRYWGASDAYPDAFAPLVDRSAGGITTAALTADLQRRGWIAISGPGDAGEMTRELGRGRPVIALVADRPGRFHYVVVTQRTQDRVVLHDPARRPSRVVDSTRFDVEWQASGRWMLILLPPDSVTAARSAHPMAGQPVRDAPVPDGDDAADGHAGTRETADAAPAAATACAAVVAQAVRQAPGDRAIARALLEQATTSCPDDGAGWRELAGLDALDGRWTEAASHARRAAVLDPEDAYAWRILATASYVGHDDLDALAAWNHLGEPVVNLIDVKGLERTRYGVVAGAIGVELKSVLTPDAVKLAERRVREIPAIAAAKVTFHPIEKGRAQIDASVVERARAPRGYAALVHAGLEAATDREVSATFSSMTGGGELTGGAWRWWEHRPMVSAFYAAPAPGVLGGGTWRLDVSRETQTFGRAPFAETRTRAAMSLANWLTDRTRLTGAAAIERWRDRPRDLALTGGIAHWRMNSRLRLAADVTRAVGDRPFTTAAATAAVRSRSRNDGMVLLALGGFSAATAASPVSSWPGADIGHARDALLRAHPLLDDGIVTGSAFGRRLSFGTIEAQRWMRLRRIPTAVAPAAFVDLARATRGLETSDARLHVDAGAGFRVALPGAAVMRIDLARGLRDGGFVLSAGWQRWWN